MDDFLKGLLNFLAYTTETGLVDKLKMPEDDGNTLYQLLEAVWSWCGLVAMGLSVIYFLMEINQKLAFEGRDVNLKSLFAPFGKFCFSIVLFGHTGEIAGSLIKIFNTALTTLDSKIATINTSTDLSNAIENVTGGGFWSGLIITLMIILIALIAVLVQFVVNFLWDVKIFSFKIEFIWRLSTAPFSLADVYSEKNSQAFRFLKSMFALIMTGIAILMLPRMTQAVISESMSDLLTSVSKDDMSGIKDGLTILRAIAEVAIMPSFLALNSVSVVKSAIKEGLN